MGAGGRRVFLGPDHEEGRGMSDPFVMMGGHGAP